ncbi:sulfatase-like hydrolase/transferase [Halobellus sp. EA9]|uniref:sulfatase-like hydrolase/transferase n=1 Tax=Halobellus sp. EA9 TaxID=3421647 RepID=UPI003EBC70AA
MTSDHRDHAGGYARPSISFDGAFDSPANVCLVVLDSVRAANCSLYGARRETTPFLAELAGESTVYHQARAPSNWSLPSHVSLFTGLETHVHEVTVHDRLEPGHTVFEELAGEYGYATGLFTENGFVAQHEVGLNGAFETVRSTPEEYADEYRTSAINPGPNGFYYADRFLEWIDDRGDGPWAACVNLMDAHRPFEPVDRYDRWGDDRARALQADLDVRWEWDFHTGEEPMWALRGLESLYDGAIRQVDAVVERLVRGLRRRGVLDETLLVVCADHGDGFGEPGRLPDEPTAVSHIVPMSEALLHVPLLVRHPGTDRRRRDVVRPASLTQFPQIARRVADGRHVPPDAFVPVGPVVASKQPVTADLRDRYEEVSDPERFFAPSRAVYTPASGPATTPESLSGIVRKTYHWGSDTCELLVMDAQSVSRPRGHAAPETAASGTPSADGGVTPDDRGSPVSDRRRERIEAAFDWFAEVDVATPREDRSLSAATKEQLASLGYY